jgi:Protein of unknown function (DUF2752)
MTRAVLAFGRADWSAATRFHPWVWLLVAQFALFAVVRSVRLEGRIAQVFIGRDGQRLLMFNVLGLLGLWGFRMATGAIPIVGG